jgi:hypothetical protein
VSLKLANDRADNDRAVSSAMATVRDEAVRCF